MLLATIGLLTFIVFVIMAVVSLIKKNGKALRNTIIAFVSLVLFVVGTVNSSDVTETGGKDREKVEIEEKKKDKKKEYDSITEEIEGENNAIDKATLRDESLTLETKGGDALSENSLFLSVYDTFEAVNMGFKDNAVNDVYVKILTNMVDEKGNEENYPVITYEYSRESFEELNYDNFLDMAYSQRWRILNEADNYSMHPGIRKKLKDKYKDNLK